MLSWIGLNMVEGLKPIHRAALLNEFRTADAIFKLSEMELSRLPEIKPEMAYRISHFDLRSAEEELTRAKKSGIHLVHLEDEAYPILLKRIPDPPLVLYVRGTLLKEEPSVALVGSRKPTPYGLNVAHFLAQDLALVHITIVSGLARGIDARAHHAALESGGRTLAVLGSGVDVIYPAEHKMLASKIAEQGAIVSEFPLSTPPDRENFPVRNRIISGLAYAVVVVEASQKSGSLITARMASEQGREVLAVPGSIFNESSRGCHSLIKDGAALAQDARDILAVLPDEISPFLRAEKADVNTDSNLTDLEKSIIASLSFDHPQHVDQLAGAVGVKSQELLAALVSLELKSYITQMPGKHYVRAK